MKKVLALLLVFAMIFCVVACAEKTPEDFDVTIDQIDLGKDYTKLEADILVLTQRTDLVENGKFDEYVAEFNKLYPNINVSYEGITDYSGTVTLRLADKTWGDICMLPPDVDKTEFENYFTPYGKQDKLEKTYQFLNEKSYDNIVYGIPSTNNAQGVVYNKAVFEAAGWSVLPKTPSDFIQALKDIKDNTDAIPLYSNYSAGWTMGAWDAYIGGCATGDTNYKNQVLPHAADPFSDNGDQTGPYAVYSVLYDAVANGLIETDPMTTDWEACKGMINRGEIGAMVLGSWAVTQMQQADENPDHCGRQTVCIRRPRLLLRDK
jgi:ABC-type glycerol-3-phosphate transport system substrate-binding protein